MIDYSAAWCFPSQEQAGHVAQASADLAAQGISFQSVTVLIEGLTGASQQRDAQNWARRFRFPPTFSVLQLNGDPNYFHGQVFQQFMSYSAVGGEPDGAFPTNVFLNPAFRIIDIHAGEMETTDIERVILSDPSAMTSLLIGFVRQGGLPSGTANSLEAKLQAVLADLRRSDTKAARNGLEAFINEVRAQYNHVPAAQASQLISHAQAVLALLPAT